MGDGHAAPGASGTKLEGWNAADGRLDVARGDQSRAFELSWRAGVPRAPQEVVVVEAMAHVVPAAVAGVIVDHPVRRGEFVGRMGEARDHYHRRADRPGEPGQPARQPDEERRVLQPAR